MAKDRVENDILMEAGKIAPAPVLEGRSRTSCWARTAARINLSGSNGLKYLKAVTRKDFTDYRNDVFSYEPRLPW